MGVAPDEQRTVDAVRAPPLADRLGDREDVVLVERVRQRAAAVPRGAERDRVGGLARIGHERVVGADEPRHVDERRARCLLSGERMGHRGRAYYWKFCTAQIEPSPATSKPQDTIA